MRLPVAIAVVTLAAAFVPPAFSLAEEVATHAGRYMVKPGDAGFVRLDTVTGAVSHCVPDREGWSCTSLDAPDVDARLSAMAGNVDELASALRQLSARVDQLAEKVDPPPASSVQAEPAPLATFVAKAMDRFVTMVRVLKYGAPPPAA